MLTRLISVNNHWNEIQNRDNNRQAQKIVLTYRKGDSHTATSKIYPNAFLKGAHEIHILHLVSIQIQSWMTHPNAARVL